MSDATRRQKLEEMHAENPNDAELHYMLAMECASGDDTDTAIRHFEQIIQNSPEYPPAYHQAGRTFVAVGKIDEARAILEKGIPIALKNGNDHAAGEMTELLESL